MSRQLRTLQQGAGIAQYPAVSTGVAAINIPAAGYSILDRAANYVLGRPAAGVMKRLVCVSSASGATTVVGSTAAALDVTFDNNARVVLTFPVSSVDQAVELLGINSTRWMITNVHPHTTDSLTPSLGTS